MLQHERFMVSQAAVIIRNDSCLILKDPNNPWWMLPGGRADVGETGGVAFKREIKEELGLDDFDILGVVDYDIWYTADENDAVCAIANLVRINNDDQIVLSHEHSEFKWITLDKIDDYDLRWPKTKRMILNAFRYKKLLEKYEK